MSGSDYDYALTIHYGGMTGHELRSVNMAVIRTNADKAQVIEILTSLMRDHAENADTLPNRSVTSARRERYEISIGYRVRDKQCFVWSDTGYHQFGSPSLNVSIMRHVLRHLDVLAAYSYDGTPLEWSPRAKLRPIDKRYLEDPRPPKIRRGAR